MAERLGLMRIHTSQAGDVREVIGFLSQIEETYNNLYTLDFVVSNASQYRRPIYDIVPTGYYSRGGYGLNPDNFVLPEDRLILSSIVIQSPGFWEFIGSLNPLQQIRDFLKDTHERRKDIEYREGAEREQLARENEKRSLENAQLRTQALRERTNLLREVGVPEEEIRQLVVRHATEPLRHLDRYAAQGVIGRVSVEPVDDSRSDRRPGST